uniref:Uncharacterized protein n=1 Tax=Ralstonia solanacearum TaxID=305 RepID=A0A0S4WF77_RALSL|nr:protein of unknown function [Ralstonia solanacearum]
MKLPQLSRWECSGYQSSRLRLPRSSKKGHLRTF